MATARLTDARPRTGGSATLFVVLSLAHGLILAAAPPAFVIAALLWWNANTISHNFIHRPFFQHRLANRAFAVWLSVLIGVPQTLWRARHLSHHAELSGHRPIVAPWRTAAVWIEGVILASSWIGLSALAPHFFVTTYLPGLAGGLALCWIHGYYEHAGGVTSHHGRLYNVLFFNDGYHVEHHDCPHASWQDLPALPNRMHRTSRWPPVLRWIDAVSLDALERVVLCSPALQRFVIARHERAFRALIPRLPAVSCATVVGGGLFPRTALVLRRIWPAVDLRIVDMSRRHLDAASRFLGRDVALECEEYDLRRPDSADLVVIPLAFRGDRAAAYRTPNAGAVVVHDWIWRRHYPGVCISWLLLKRLNLVRR
jgi:hypothetical protein